MVADTVNAGRHASPSDAELTHAISINCTRLAVSAWITGYAPAVHVGLISVKYVVYTGHASADTTVTVGALAVGRREAALTVSAGTT